MKARGERATHLAAHLGISKQALHGVLSGERPGVDHLLEIAKFLKVRPEWLTTGAESVAPDWLRAAEPSPVYGAPGRTAALVVRETGAAYAANGAELAKRDAERPEYDPEKPGEVAMVGSVAAGPGLVTFDDHPRAFAWRSSWVVYRVVGDSAFPLAFDGQFVVADTNRPHRHNNVVVVETREDGQIRRYLKRYCVDRRAPDGYVLASINAGVDTPYIPARDVLAFVPVVGVLFEEEPRPEE